MGLIKNIKYILVGLVIGALLGINITFAALPANFNDRKMNRYVETDDGNVGVRIQLVQ